jgi:hypothetical protein
MTGGVITVGVMGAATGDGVGSGVLKQSVSLYNTPVLNPMAPPVESILPSILPFAAMVQAPP